MYGRGIFLEGELLAYHIEKETIIKSGSWFQYKDHKIQGTEKMAEFIREHIEEFEIK